jgi:uncharacterized protein YuzE
MFNPPVYRGDQHSLDPVALIRQHAAASYSYDEDADVLYLSFGAPRPAVGVDGGGGAVVMVDEANNQIAGITFIGLRRLVERELAEIAAETGAAR